MNLRKITLLFSILILSIMISYSSEVAVISLKLPETALGTGLGEAVTALHMYSEGVFWNPASISHEDKMSLSLSYSTLIFGFKMNNLSFLYPTRRFGNFGLGLNYFNQGSIKETTIYEPDGTGENLKSYDLLTTLTYGRLFFEKLSLGFALKHISSKLADETGSAIAFDFGSIFNFNENFAIGIWLTNISSGITYIKESDNLPQQFRVGGFYSFDTVLFTLDLVQDYEDGFGVGIGSQLKVYRDIFLLRLGYKTYDSVSAFSIGIQLNYNNFSLGYAYVPVSEESLYDFNQISLGYKF
ncbi:PorV/PorQ family protein [Candidatus Dependentiae bacterium]|nr:PorV/PorQ family protein [Candidatus Dependentiae bacterium]